MRTILEILQRNMLKHPLLLLVFLLFATGSMFAQDGATVKNDTIYNPEVLYSATPKKYEIAGISVSGVKNNYEDYVLIGFSGLSVGETIEIPGDAITTAVKRFWRQGLFSDVAISVTKIYGSQVWLNIDLKQRPRISQINYNGIKKSEREDLELKLGLVKGNQITPNIVDRAKMLIKKHFEEKGFKNAEVQILQKDDLSHENQVIVDINIDKKEKVKEKPVVKEVIKEVVKEVKVPVPAETMMKISDIEPNRDQPRKNFDKEALDELADSIRQFGIIQPIVVQKKDDYYEIIAGERRWRAAKLAKIKEVPVIVKEYTPQEVMEIALIENIQRRDLNPIEEALAYRSLINEYNLKQDELAKRVSKSRAAIANSMRLLRLAEPVQNMLVEGQISMGHARALLALELEDLQVDAANTIMERGLSVRDTEKLVKSILNPKQSKLPIPSSEEAIYSKLSDKLKEIMGTKVSINHKKGGKGKIEIEYYSQEELERLLELFNGIQN